MPIRALPGNVRPIHDHGGLVAAPLAQLILLRHVEVGVAIALRHEPDIASRYLVGEPAQKRTAH